MAGEKINLNLAVIGHIDHGKSTTMGRLLYETGAIPERIIEQYRQEAARLGKTTFEFAWVFDKMKEERERGITIDISHYEFETPKYHVTIIDCPGHKDFVKNMIKGTNQADHAILVVSAKEGPQEQTREHALLAKTAGVKQLIVFINKMDTVNYDQKRFEEVKQQVLDLLKKCGWKDNEIVAVIPGSGYNGDNVTKRSDKMPWYDGPTLVEAIDMLKEPELPIDKPLRLAIQDVYNIKGVGLVPVGRVYTGVMKTGDKVVIMPIDKEVEVKSIQMFHKQIPEAKPGDNIGFNIKGPVEKKEIRRGDVVGHPDNKPTVALEFIARIIVVWHPTAISVGYTPVIHAHEASVAGQFIELIRKIDPRTGETKEENPSQLKPGDIAEVRIKPIKPMCVEEVQQFPPLGRIAVRDMGQTVAVGQIIKITEKK